ncbi:MAG: FG-GAP repeat domain-containing protein, partial [Thermoanaerobaculia bacterium]
VASVSDTNWKIAGIGDFQGDGKDDVLWRNSSTGADVVWLMNGTTAAVSALLPTVGDLNWKVAGLGDLQGEGKADIVWRKRHRQQCGLVHRWNIAGSECVADGGARHQLEKWRGSQIFRETGRPTSCGATVRAARRRSG